MHSDANENNGGKKHILARYQFLLFNIIMVLFVIIAIELIGAVMLNMHPDYKILREIFLGDTDKHIVHNQNTIGQAYLLYTPAPNFERKGVLQHNSAGYRGELVPLKRRADTLRILFLGGSTTYGWRVEHPNDTYPAQIGIMLEKALGNRFNDIEILNAGLMWGSTAEILTHYHFKYQYYNPDIVVINTGGNDSEASQLKKFYHPDYSHYRNQLPAVHPLPPSTRWVLHSRLISFFSIHIFFKDLIQQRRFDKTAAPTTRWYSGQGERGEIPEEHLAFKRNLETIIREIKANGSEILVLPFQMKPGNKFYTQAFKTELANNQRILEELAEKESLAYAPFPTDVITHRNWSDACHLNAPGSREKARHVLGYLLPLIDKKFKPIPPPPPPPAPPPRPGTN